MSFLMDLQYVASPEVLYLNGSPDYIAHMWMSVFLSASRFTVDVITLQMSNYKFNFTQEPGIWLIIQ